MRDDGLSKSLGSTESPKYRIGVALSGGGARGFAHLGALKAMQEAGLKIDVLAGVSAGSVAAVLYSAGIPVEQAMDEFRKCKFSDFAALNFHFSKNSGLFSLERFEKFISDLVSPYNKLEELPIPTYIGVTDFDAGTQAEFHDGEIAPRVIASCSIPICFPPKIIDGIRYVDGGVVRNMPSWLLRRRCKYLIGINCSPVMPQNSQNGAGSIPEIVMRTFSLMCKANQKTDLKICDFALEFPEISNYKVFNLKQINDIFLRGYTTMRYAINHSPLLTHLVSECNEDK